MSNNTIIVPVQEESNHKELYNDVYIRVYLARLAPGQATKMHSHNRDTLYFAIKGGEIETVCHALDEGCSNKVVKSYPITYKLKLLFSKIRKKPLTLVDGFSFFMASSKKRVVHKAIASIKNKDDMRLIGVEFKDMEKNHS